MNTPSWKKEQSERVLEADEIANLPCTAVARRLASEYGATVVQSERATFDRRFGYIYRYVISAVEADDEGEIIVRTVLVVSSQDCKSFAAATHPMFEPPQPK